MRFNPFIVVFFAGCLSCGNPGSEVKPRETKKTSVKAYRDPSILEGKYLGKNLYVQNPFDEDGNGFCIYEISVNGTAGTGTYESSAFEIDLSKYGLKIGDKVVIKIKHKDSCTPKILNPEVIDEKFTK